MKRHKKGVQNAKPAETEGGWGNESETASWRWLAWVPVICLPVVAVIGIALCVDFGGRNAKEDRAPTTSDHGMSEAVDAAEEVARAFLKEADPVKQLRWVRNAGEVRTRLEEYPDEARSGVGEIESMLGHRMDGGLSVTAFVVAFPSGNLRLLEVVGTPDGQYVDWDAYARHTSASWEDFWSGEAERAVVRVFCEPSTERVAPFEDQGKWFCLRMTSPDLPQAVLGYAAAGGVREAKMKEAVLGTPKFRQRFTLEILRHEGAGEPVFEIVRCLAVGWIVDGDLEAQWE